MDVITFLFMEWRGGERGLFTAGGLFGVEVMFEPAEKGWLRGGPRRGRPSRGGRRVGGQANRAEVPGAGQPHRGGPTGLTTQVELSSLESFRYLWKERNLNA